MFISKLADLEPSTLDGTSHHHIHTKLVDLPWFLLNKSSLQPGQRPMKGISRRTNYRLLVTIVFFFSGLEVPVRCGVERTLLGCPGSRK